MCVIPSEVDSGVEGSRGDDFFVPRSKKVIIEKETSRETASHPLGCFSPTAGSACGLDLRTQPVGAVREDEDHDRFDREERDGLGRILPRPLGDSEECAYARGPVDPPGQSVLAGGILPRRHEGRNGSEEHHRERRHDPEHRAVERLPQDDSQSRSTEAELVQERPPRLAVLEGEDSHGPGSQDRSRDLAVDRPFHPHAGEGDRVECRPDEPGRFHGRGDLPEDRTDVGNEGGDEENSRQNVEDLLHGMLLRIAESSDFANRCSKRKSTQKNIKKS